MRNLLATFVLTAVSAAASAQVSSPTDAAPESLYAVEFTIGPAWDKSKSPGEQTHFREHSGNLKRLREQGVLLLGARYSDKGFIVVRARSEQDARAMIQQDPSVQGGVFKFELHEFNVFYPGAVPAKPRAQ
jgi:uncharacterized protein YciI